MTDPRARSSELGVEIPTLEPDDAFIVQLAALAAQAARPPAHPVARGGWRIAVAAASVAGVVGGGAWLAAAVTGTESPTPPTPPATHPQPDHEVANPTKPGGGASPSTGRTTDPDASPSLPTGADDGTAPAAQPTSGGAGPGSGADQGPGEHGVPQGDPGGGEETSGAPGSPGVDDQDGNDERPGPDDQDGTDDQNGAADDQPSTGVDAGDSSDLPDAAEVTSGSDDRSAGG